VHWHLHAVVGRARYHALSESLVVEEKNKEAGLLIRFFPSFYGILSLPFSSAGDLVP
jgi:hypothetical protein